jgi:polar amino acid transport system substrate-binding protein
MTAEREERIDFSYPYYRTGLGAAVGVDRHPGLGALAAALTAPGFLGTITLLTALLFLVGLAAWLVERRHNPQQFEPGPARGLFSGFWWAAVTMTTVGYGDKAPVTFLGRALGIVWMYAALILTAAFTAQLAASLTRASVVRPLTNPAELSQLRVGFVEDAASLGSLQALGVRPTAYASVSDGLEALADGEVEAFVHDQPILSWFAQPVTGVRVADLSFAPQDYAIVLPEDSSHRERVNRALLQILGSDAWGAIQRRYLGG